VSDLSLPVPLEEAAKCPKCGKPGILVAVQPVPDEKGGGHVNAYNCDNEGCVWGQEHSGWLVQTDRRGHVFERERGSRGMDKDFPKMTPGQLSMGRAILEDAIQSEHIDKSKKER
jgi:hypothetical protein